jgi:nucleoside 2-deoxyribosyltransferase
MMLQVTGGTYREYCREGEWSQLYGSGLRAAAALQRHCQPAALTTYVGRDDEVLAEAIANTFDVQLQIVTIPQTVEFHYLHGLSVPSILPPLHLLAQQAPLSVEAEHVLRFGFIEGDAVVHGKRVVYDPQSAYDPDPFAANGSTADNLAIVCNRREAFLLTNESKVEESGRKLFAQERASVVVLKCGSDGALVFEQGKCVHVPAYRTNRVWPIGSGDVFAAVFAGAWAVNELDCTAAAALASKSTAYYCLNKTLPIPDFKTEEASFDPPAIGRHKGGEVPLVYLAGPFFNMMQRWLIEEARDALADQGVRVFSPLHDVGFGLAEDVVPADIEAIKKSNAMFAILDDLDSGTLFEIGYARANGIPVVGFAQNVSDESLKMLRGTECQICDDFVTAIYQLIWAIRS